jgi:hypothetical protein
VEWAWPGKGRLQVTRGVHDSLVAERHEEDITGEQLQDMNGGGGMEVPEDRRRLGLGKLD